jgi:hypothetical protein
MHVDWHHMVLIAAGSAHTLDVVVCCSSITHAISDMKSSSRSTAASIAYRIAMAICICLLPPSLQDCTDDGVHPAASVSASEFWMPLLPGNSAEFLVISSVVSGSWTLNDTILHRYTVAASTVRSLDGAIIRPVRVSWSGAHPDSMDQYPHPTSDAVLVYGEDLEPAHADTVLRLPFTAGNAWRMANQPQGRISITSADTAVSTPAGLFEHCVCTRTEWADSADSARISQCFARGVGLIRYDMLRLNPGGGTAMRITSSGVLVSKNY